MDKQAFPTLDPALWTTTGSESTESVEPGKPVCPVGERFDSDPFYALADVPIEVTIEASTGASIAAGAASSVEEPAIPVSLLAIPVEPAVTPVAVDPASAEPETATQVSSVMEEKLWTVHAEDTIEKVEEILAAQGLSSVPVMGSDGAIVGMIGTHELAQFHVDKKNPKVVRAWEISNCTTFEVSPTDSVEDVARLMAENKIENIAVTADGGLQGVVSVQGLVQVILNENAESSADPAAKDPDAA